MSSLTYYPHSITWKQSLGGYPETFSSTTVSCRYQPKQKLILQADGKQKLSQAMIRTASAIQAGDRITYGSIDSLVISSSAVLDIAGSVMEYEIWI